MEINTQKAYYKGTHHYSYRCGELAEIIEVVFVNVENISESRACFHIKYADGKEDYTPISDLTNYSLHNEEDIRKGYVNNK